MHVMREKPPKRLLRSPIIALRLIKDCTRTIDESDRNINQDLSQQLLLAAEVAVKSWAGNANSRADILQPSLMKPSVGNNRGSSGENFCFSTPSCFGST